MRWSLLPFYLFALSLPALGDEGHHHALTEQEVGSVQFSTSCSNDVAQDFNRAIALLHSFQYEKTRETFTGITSRDPACAMAYWGIAMSHYHGLWDNGDAAAGRAALRKAQEMSASNSKITQREHSYIDALGEIYKDDGKDKAVHAQAFEQKMAALQAAFPDDTEAAIFHALSLAITAPKTDKTFANQRKCGEILEPIFVRNPHHPGVAHYIIHCYDNPALAEQGLNAARLYAKIRLRPRTRITCRRIFLRGLDHGTSRSVPTSGPRRLQPPTKPLRRMAKPATSAFMPWIIWNTPICKAGARLRQKRYWMK